LGLREAVDLAVLDVAMPRMTGLQAAAELSQQLPALRVLMLSMYDSEQYLYEALRAGASGYVLKSAADRDLVEACRAAMRGQPFPLPRCGDRAHPRLSRPRPSRRRAVARPAHPARARDPQADPDRRR
jgi:DNA-binding NarL/FixJ family response regulator